MNKVFKTKWSSIRQQYVVTDEHHAAKGKASKSAVALAVASILMIGAGAASAAYQEPGFIAGTHENLQAAEQSWQTAEFQKDWGLAALKAQHAYALGFHGQDTAVGVMDSGALLQGHPELAGDRFHASHNKGTYSGTGNRYPQGAGSQFNGKYTAGESFDVTGDWKLNVNDSHGTHVTGTVGANRDGSEFHGVSWGSEIWVGNTGGTDDSNYGPFLDYGFFKAGWSQLAQDIIKVNGEKRGGVINNSFGTNTRVVANNSKGADGFSTSVHLPVNSVSESEYEFFLFNNVYGQGKSFVDGAYEAVKDTNVVQIMTTGNRDMKNPYYRALYPYFNPQAESHWIAVAGLKQNGDKYELIKSFNEAGLAKWWTVVGPGSGIYSSAVVEGSYVEPGKGEGAGKELGDPTYAAWGGTSMAAPHVAGSMGVLMSRYKDMSAVQVRDVLFTTATHKNADGSNFEGWDNKDGSTPAEGEVSDRMGWGLPDLEKGMHGPGQLLGHFDYDMSTQKLDVWTNDITEVALKQREREDKAWMAAAKKWIEKGQPLTLGSEFTAAEKELIGDIILDSADDIVGLDAKQEAVSEADAKAWRKKYFEDRIAEIEKRQYFGSLNKKGAGTLVMTGNNTFTGGVTVEDGTLLGFNDSFGITETTTRAIGNGLVTVNGGKFGVISKYNDTFTKKGEITDTAKDHSVDAVINKGGTFLMMAGQDVEMGSLTFKEGSGYTVGSTDVDVLDAAYKGTAQTGSLTVEKLEGFDLAVANPDYALFKTELVFDEATSSLTGTLSRNEAVTLASYGSGNGNKIGQAVEGAGTGDFYDSLLPATKAQVESTYASLGDDFYLNNRNASVVNGMTLTRAVKDQAAGIGEGRVAEMADGTARLWATGVGAWSSIDYGNSDMDSDFYAGLIGAEVDVADSTKVGVFFGAGTTENKAGSAKVESDDIHVGLYGFTNVQDVVAVNYGFTYTHQSADAHRTLNVLDQAAYNKWSGDTDITQIFAEAAYTGFNTAAYSVEPYFGLSWIHAKSDGFSETAGGMTFTTSPEDQDLQVTTLGVRGGVPFQLGSTKLTVKGDVAWNHFFGDTEAEARMDLAGSGTAVLKGGELSDMATVGLGVEAQLTKTATFGLSYTGAYDGDVTSHGVSANLRFAF